VSLGHNKDRRWAKRGLNKRDEFLLMRAENPQKKQPTLFIPFGPAPAWQTFFTFSLSELFVFAEFCAQSVLRRVFFFVFLITRSRFG
jgi:hypothetical protein